jgi:dihydroxyacetone kinase-like protein
MKEYLDIRDLKSWLKKSAELIEGNREYLSELDSHSGDGDHGANLSRGFQALMKSEETTRSETLASYLESVGALLGDRIGGSYGALLGLFFKGMAVASEGKEQLEREALAKAFEVGKDAIFSIGKAKLGDKTMVDALLPAIQALQRESNLGEALEKAALEASKGAERTKTMKASLGRARFLGERSIGAQDAGATSMALLLRALWVSYQSDCGSASRQCRPTQGRS